MDTHVNLRERIARDIGNRVVKLLVGPVGAGKSYFLAHDLFNGLSKKDGIKIVEINPRLEKDPLPRLLQMSETNGTHFVILADDVFSFSRPESIFDACAGKSNVDLIATSSFDPGLALGEKETLIRGRFEKYYFSPLFYSEALELGLVYNLDEYLSRGGLFLSKEVCLEETIREWLAFKRLRGDYEAKMSALFDIALSHADTPLSFEKMMSLAPFKVSKPCLISYFDFLKGAFLLLDLRREDLLKERIKACESVYYPGDVALGKGKANREALEKSLLLMKLFEKSFRVSSGYVYGNFGGKFQATNVAFVLRKGRDKAYLSYAASDGARESETMAKFLKDSFPKVVVVPFDVAPWKDGNGIVHVGLERFLLSDIADILGGRW